LDILIPLGKGSRWQDNELRYCLRSIEKSLVGVGNIFIVGECPEWLTGVIHIPFSDVPGYGYRDKNIFLKIMAGCEDKRLSDDFLFMNDDHYLLQNFIIEEFPYFNQGLLKDKINSMGDGIPYKKVLVNTYDAMRRHHWLLDFDVHCPIIYNKKRFALSFPEIKSWPDYGFAIKSMYCNKNGIEGIACEDLKFRDKLTAGQIKVVLQGRSFFSIGDRCLHGEMKQVLEELYPIKSKYEL